mmetsp:Transcript_2653/g.9546  ORF Transcript_2653/g.9546 Transcript_2653/m.9546 type:complete len:651 (-) Transcript_2653:86-2038(-)
MPPPRREHGRHAARANASSATAHGHSSAHGPSRGKVAVPKPVILPSMRADTGASVDVVVASAFSTSARTWGNAGGSGASVRGLNAGAPSARDGDGGDGGAEEASLASVGATWGRRETTTTTTSEIRDDRVAVVRRGEYPSLRSDASGGDERPARTVASDVERAARRYADEHRGYEHRAEEDERYVGPTPDTAGERDVDARGGRRHSARGEARGFGGGRGRDRRGATAPTRILTRRERDDDETTRSSAGEIPGMTSPSTTHAAMPTSPVALRAREVDPKTEEERAAFDKELDAVAEEIARRRQGGEPDASERSPSARAQSENDELTMETAAATTSPRRHAPLTQDAFDPYAAPNISASALLREPIVPAAQKSVERDEHVVDRPGSEFLRAQGGVKSPPMVLRRPTPPPATRAVPERDAGTEASSSDDGGGGGGGGGGGDKARKRRGGRRVREREERRALRTTKGGKVATYDDDGMAASLAPDGGWGGQPYAGYGAANVPVPGGYVHAFADSARLFTTFAPPTYHGYVPGGYAQYGYSPQAAPPMWQPDASLTQYIGSVPVAYPVDTLYSATGTYGDDATAVAMPSDVERLSARLNDLPASLGAEFGSTDDLASFAENKDAAHAPAPVRRRGSRGGARGRAVAANGQGGAQQ